MTEYLLWATHRATGLRQAPPSSSGGHSPRPSPVTRESEAQGCEVALAGAWGTKMAAIADCRSWARMNSNEGPLLCGWTAV